MDRRPPTALTKRIQCNGIILFHIGCSSQQYNTSLQLLVRSFGFWGLYKIAILIGNCRDIQKFGRGTVKRLLSRFRCQRLDWKQKMERHGQ